MRQVVILRPEPGASATYDKAVELGLGTVKLPLFEIEPVEWSLAVGLEEFDGLLVTSANAMREGGPGLAPLDDLPVYAVGPASAVAAREAGFEVVRIGAGNLHQLLRAIDPGLRLLHLAGEDRVDQRRVWQKITTVPVYRTRTIDPIDPAPILGGVAVIHSPRAGARLAEIVPDRSTVAVAAISGAAAEACGEGWESIQFVSRPSDPALLALAARLCEKSAE